MSAVAWVLFSILTAMLVLLIAILITPTKLHLAFRSQPRRQIDVTVRPLGGLFPSLPIRSKKPEDQKEAPAEDAEEIRSGWISMRRMIGASPDLLIGLLRAIHVEQLIIDADIGFKDPADTGQVYGALTPLIWAIPPTSRFSVNVRPDFDQSTFSGRLDTTLSFVPVAFVPPIARFGWHAFGPWRR